MISLTQKGIEKAKELLVEFLESLTEEELEEFEIAKSPPSALILHCVLTAYSAMKMEMRTQAWYRRKMKEILGWWINGKGQEDQGE